MSARPVVAITACRRERDGVAYDEVRRRYVDIALRLDMIPLIVPAGGRPDDLVALAERIDGVILTGSESNVEPARYGEPALPAAVLRDRERDATVLPALARLIALEVPLLGICRGLQELNVAYGGTLHQQLSTVAGMGRHDEDLRLPRDEQYLPAHQLRLAAGGVLARLYGAETIAVNTLHRQGIARLGRGLAVEATAPDGLVEAVRVAGAASFALAVQWHPEWRADDASGAPLFAEFGRFCARRAARREAGLARV